MAVGGRLRDVAKAKMEATCLPRRCRRRAGAGCTAGRRAMERKAARRAPDTSAARRLAHLLTYSLLTLAGVHPARRGRGLDRRRTHPAAGAPAHRRCPGGMRAEPVPAHRAAGPARRAARAGRHLRHDAQRLQTARSTGQRQFIANASHELRTPLTVMRTTVDVVLAKPEPARRSSWHGGGRPAGGRPRRAAHRGAAGAGPQRARPRFATRWTWPPSPRTSWTPPTAATCGCTPRWPRPGLGDPLLLERLVANLVDNAVRHNVTGGELWLTTSTVDGNAR